MMVDCGRRADAACPAARCDSSLQACTRGSRPPKKAWGALDYSKWDDIGNSSDENDDKESSSAASTLKDAINEAMRDLVPPDGEEKQEGHREGEAQRGEGDRRHGLKPEFGDRDRQAPEHREQQHPANADWRETFNEGWETGGIPDGNRHVRHANIRLILAHFPERERTC